MRLRHILWDWNGTLLDDTEAACRALCEMLARRGKPPISLAFYRAHFAFPVRSFYRAVGIRLEEEDWDLLAREYHETYSVQSVALTSGAEAVLASVRAQGVRQSVVSALRQDILERQTREWGVTEYFSSVCGTDNLDGSSKLSRATMLVDELTRAGEADGLALIGDSLHDKEVADALGIGCVLFSGGSHAAERLRAVAPTAATLEEAVCLADGLLGEALHSRSVVPKAERSEPKDDNRNEVRDI